MSFLFELDPAKEASADFIAEVGRRLQAALMERKLNDQLTQSEIARRIGVDRSRVNRCFSGHANLTIGTLAEIAWALDFKPDFDLLRKQAASCVNYYHGCEDEVGELGFKEVIVKHSSNNWQKSSQVDRSISVYEYDDA
ncbi:helix-turn-helix domain-containing protein [Brucella anthropi]|uniref:helix-turn-helix domain-containing protein n=1 Tax=Brucella anthropi TaxID=529 RepID=UPI00241E4F7B|nr:helix-turn-helix transcriptional regulator [Brucella anthropi]MDG9793043.1 helix-turn-helix domain-containing protein [Brucella anthropi]MDH0580201.1 helix-turn-helix domain-containing protein [Brucella anthropi]MDH0816825.1 helix-turn-helix domain-containing protein [Brucella anthropi]MDH2083357.1 helix-turn-helix domain-containing protein [Brucella anthropi]